MRGSSLVSKQGSLVCPLCEVGHLRAVGRRTACCDCCEGSLNGVMLEVLRQITALPDAQGRHACECGHPEMRRLPDETYHCPACGTEIPTVTSTLAPSNPAEASGPYWAGWVDGRFGNRGSFVDNPNLARWEAPVDRLDYYRGHRAGSEARRTTNDPNPDPREELFGGGAR